MYAVDKSDKIFAFDPYGPYNHSPAVRVVNANKGLPLIFYLLHTEKKTNVIIRNISDW